MYLEDVAAGTRYVRQDGRQDVAAGTRGRMGVGEKEKAGRSKDGGRREGGRAAVFFPPSIFARPTNHDLSRIHVGFP